MREFAIPTSKPKLRLLDAAERQVAEKGFDAVSVRDVTESAKANVAAVNYHFGSREGMMALLIARRMLPIQQEQLDRLRVLEKKHGNKGAPLEELMDALLRPLVVLSGKWPMELALAHRLLSRILSLPVESLPQPVEASMNELWTRYLKALSKSLPEVQPEELAWRLHFISGGLIQLLAGSEALKHWARLSIEGPVEEPGLGRFLRFAVAGLREGVAVVEPAAPRKGPQATFDF